MCAYTVLKFNNNYALLYLVGGISGNIAIPEYTQLILFTWPIKKLKKDTPFNFYLKNIKTINI